MGCCESSSKGQAPKGGHEVPTKAYQDNKPLDNDGDGIPEQWPWSRPTPDQRRLKGKRAADYYYTREYLNSFRILNNVEVQAYEAYQNNDKALARKILDSDVPAVLGKPAAPSVENTPEEVHIAPHHVLPEVERVRGGSMAGHGTNVHQLEEAVPTELPKSPRTAQRLLLAVKQCTLFAHLSSNFNEHEIVAQAMRHVAFPVASAVLTAGEHPPEQRRGWYVVTEGRVQYKRKGHKAKEVRGPGDSFGELLVTNVTATSMIDVSTDAATPAVCYFLSHDSYANLLSRIAHRRREAYKRALKRVTVGDAKPFHNMHTRELAQLADCLTEKLWAPGETLLKYGEQGHNAYFILRGTVEVMGRKDGQPFKVCEFSAGEDPVGFLEFFESGQAGCNIADVVAKETGSGVVTASITREHFERCMGPVKEILKDATNASNVYDYYRETKRG